MIDRLRRIPARRRVALATWTLTATLLLAALAFALR
jgi:hypothetical protein